jgi:hypothetical protein
MSELIIKHPGYKYLRIGHGPPAPIIRWEYCLEDVKITDSAIRRVAKMRGFPVYRDKRGRKRVEAFELLSFLGKHDTRVRKILGLPKRGST